MTTTRARTAEDPVPGATEGWSGPCLLFEFEVPTAVGNAIQSDSLAFSLDFTAVQARHNGLRASDTGTGFVDVSQSTNVAGGYGEDDEDFASKTMTGRARFGGVNTYELATDAGSPSGDQQEVHWAPLLGTPLGFTYTYDADADTGTFALAGGAVSSTVTGVSAPAGRIGVQAKADEATVTVDNLALSADGNDISVVGPDGVTASNDGAGRAISYVVLDTAAADLANGFVLSGDATITLQGDFPGSDESVALDVVVE